MNLKDDEFGYHAVLSRVWEWLDWTDWFDWCIGCFWETNMERAYHTSKTLKVNYVHHASFWWNHYIIYMNRPKKLSQVSSRCCSKLPMLLVNSSSGYNDVGDHEINSHLTERKLRYLTAWQCTASTHDVDSTSGLPPKKLNPPWNFSVSRLFSTLREKTKNLFEKGQGMPKEMN